MATAVIVDAVRTAGRQAQREAVRLAPGRPGRRDAPGPGRAQRPRSGAHRRRDHGLRHAGRPPGPEHRPQRRPGRRLARVGARHHRRPPVRLVAAVGPLRRPGRDRRRLRRRRRRRGRGHEHHPDGRLGHARVHALRPQDDGALRRRRRPRAPGHLGRAHRRQVGPVPRGPRRLRGAEPAAGAPGHRGGPLRAARSSRSRASSGTGRRARSSSSTSSSAGTRASAPAPPPRRWPT